MDKPSSERWPTPMSRDYKDGKKIPPSIQSGKRNDTLGTAVLRWPTPTARDGGRNEKLETWKARRDRREQEGSTLHKPLDIAVLLDKEKDS